MRIKGEITFPGDKSISHRLLMFAAFADGTSRISNLSTGLDVMYTRKCMEACGIQIWDDGNDVVIKGGKFTDPKLPLYCGNSGTTTRLMLGLLAGQGINATFTGDDSLSNRPMSRILDPLSQMNLRSESHHGNLPVTINKSVLKGTRYDSPLPSAQIKSAVLLAGLGASSDTSVTEQMLSRDHTERILQEMGAEIITDGLTVTISPLKSPLSPIKLSIPGDPSTGAFFAAAAVMIPGSNIILNRILRNPTRIGFYSALYQMGGGLEILDQWDETGESIGKLKAFHQPLTGISITKNDVPELIDELPIIAILATQAEGKTKINGAKELRVKECDRIHAVCTNLKRMGADIEELKDGFIINGPTQIKGAEIETFHDHRIAMAFTIAGLVADGDVVLDDPECISISYPEFYDELARLKQ